MNDLRSLSHGTDIAQRLEALHRVVCEDALFAIASAGLDALEAFAKRRAAAYETVAREGIASAVVMADWIAWRRTLTRAIAPVSPPWFVPMHEAIARGLTLEGGPRGLRAVLPIGVEAERARIRRDGMFAVRVARAVSAADGTVSADEARSVDLLISALGLDGDDARILDAEAPIPLAALEAPRDLDAKLARSIVHGAFHAAAVDGLDDLEASAVEEIAARLSVDTLLLEELRSEAVREIEARRTLGRALLDVVRYVLAPLPADESTPFALAVVHLAIPAIDRVESERIAASLDAPTPLGRRHDIEKGPRSDLLAATWAAALATDTKASMRAWLALRHDRVGADLGAERHAKDARDRVDDHIAAEMARGAAAAGA